jgi:MarR family transcriptional regulator, lower aerobic nicotinate degradation pathway regulator
MSGVDDDLDPTPAHVDALVQLSFAVQAVLVRAATEAGLSVTLLRLLGILRDRTPPMSDLAEHLGLDRSSITGLVDRAERRGLVTRSPGAHDARVTLVGMTAAGRDVARRTATAVAGGLAALVEGVPAADRAALVRVADTVLGPRPPFGFAPAAGAAGPAAP